ncbi:MAG: efflux RND transporter permease subunit [Terriglobales bacterium]
MNIVRFCRENRYAVYLLTGFLMVGGAVAVFRLPSNIYPELNFPRVVILAHSGDLAPDTMLLNVTRPLEEAAGTVQGMRRVRSRTIRGACEISLLFAPDMDMQYALQLVQAQVNDRRSLLPPDTTLEVARVTPVVFPVLSLILNGNVPGKDLRDYAFYVLRPIFTRVPGVGQVEVMASDIREVSVIVDPQKLLAHRLSLVDVADRLKATNEVTSVGRLPKDYQQYLVLTTSQFANLEDIRNTPIAIEGQTPVLLREVAEVVDGVEDRQTLVTGNGQPAALINISRQIGGNILQIASDVKQQAAHLGSAVPSTLRLTVVYDLAEFVSESIASVRDAILIGAFLAVLILFVFLREVRTTIVATAALPLSVIGTFFFLKMLGGTLNLMSLGGLAIAIGLIIDDAVVVMENIYRHLGRGEDPHTAAERGTRELIGPVVSSTATTLVVFLPLGLLKGVVGDFFGALSLTLAVSVLLSLIFSLTVIPLLSQSVLVAGSHKSSAEAFIQPVLRIYERLVRWGLSHQKFVGLVTLGVVLTGALIYTQLETGFLPEMDEGGFVLDYWMPSGTSLAETDHILHDVEDRIQKLPEVAAFSRRTGAEMGPFVTEQNRGDVLVKLKPRAERNRGTEDVIADLRAQIEKSHPGMVVEFVQVLQDMLGDLEGSPEPVEVKIFGPSMATLEEAVGDVGEKIKKIPGLVDYKAILRGNPEILFHVDPASAARVGMTVDQVTQQVSAGLLGLSETSLRQADRTIDIRVRFNDQFRYNYENLQQFPVVTPDRKVVPLSVLARLEERRGVNELSRENLRLMVALTGRLEDRDLGSVVGDVQKIMKSTRLPAGCFYEIGGQYASQQASFRELLGVLALALAAVFAVLVIQFRSPGPALMILSAAPLSLVGVFAMLKLTGTPLNVSSLMGIILMVGLVVKNGIILFEYVHKLQREENLPLREALVQAGRIRVRPILMTTLATLFGLLPLALGLGSGAELQKPLALAVIGGLLLSMFITLLVVPILYSASGEWGRGA